MCVIQFGTYVHQVIEVNMKLPGNIIANSIYIAGPYSCLVVNASGTDAFGALFI